MTGRSAGLTITWPLQTVPVGQCLSPSGASQLEAWSLLTLHCIASRGKEATPSPYIPPSPLCLPPWPALLLPPPQAGLCALKTPQSLGEECSKEDPLHLPAFRRLAATLPFAKHAHSKLICSISRAPMDENDPPMALPNGCVYSQGALRQMAAADGGRITCPRTGDACDIRCAPVLAPGVGWRCAGGMRGSGLCLGKWVLLGCWPAGLNACRHS